MERSGSGRGGGRGRGRGRGGGRGRRSPSTPPVIRVCMYFEGN